MLQNILPGLREIRAPLSAGYVWLVGLWTLLWPIFKERDLTGTIYGRVVELSVWSGRPATLIAISFVAYLLGVLSGSLTSLINRNSFRILGNVALVRRFIPYYKNEKREARIIEDTIHSKLVRRYETDSSFKARVLGHWRRAGYMSQKYGHKLDETAWTGLTDEEVERAAEEDVAFREHFVLTMVDVERHLPHSRTDADFIRYRLAGKEDQIYNEYDRAISEGEFRLGLAVPSLFLWISLAIVDSPLRLAGTVFSVSIAYIGARCFSDAGIFLYSIIAAGRVPLEGFDQLRPDQIRMAPYDRLLAVDSPKGTRNPVDISLSEHEFRSELSEDERGVSSRGER